MRFTHLSKMTGPTRNQQSCVFLMFVFSIKTDYGAIVSGT